MPSTKHYRRTWFALLKEAAIPEQDRHWVQAKHTGKESTRDWTPGNLPTSSSSGIDDGMLPRATTSGLCDPGLRSISL